MKTAALLTAIVLATPAAALDEMEFRGLQESWQHEYSACRSGEDHEGSKVTQSDKTAACVEARSLHAQLTKAGYCYAGDMHWTVCTSKVWVDATCRMTMESKNDIFTVATTDGKFSATCDIASWPLDTPVASLACGDGVPRKMEVFSDGTLKVDGTVLLTTGDDRIICD